MVAASPFSDLDHAVRSARDIWFNKVDVKGWLESFAAHPEIGGSSKSISQWSKEEQSVALAAATGSTMQELVEWNARYKEKFGFVFLICASGRGTPDILAELKKEEKRYLNRPIVELEIAAQEEMKIIELRLEKLFKFDVRTTPSETTPQTVSHSNKAEDRIGRIGAHISAASKAPEPPEVSAKLGRTRPPITTHVLDVARGSPAAGLEVQLEMWKSNGKSPSFVEQGSGNWLRLGSSFTNTDGRSGHLMEITEYITPGFYRISFDTGKYAPSGFYPYVSIVFEIKEAQKAEHFHAPLLFSPFSITTYRGS
ncbi:uncharacterized protein M6B38_287675 [Iris pallida]|uniref:Hydroxyisourate hydrolase n=1 Tax=Iris pallida TaxID=29817 RepID=A0AAX6HXX3_IRIPA|nr:uncharacterized protein M6B38_287675 [Iris pallida]